MRITSIEIAGFRGIRDALRIDVPKGFVVISGRNGTGKSTICDAIEFALTGSISRLAAKKERQETLADYLWWRGLGRYQTRRVALGLADEEGREYLIERTGERLTPDSYSHLAALCGGRQEELLNAIQHLCRTAIVRSESIADLSLDLPETERFELVKAAIGSVDFSDIERLFVGALSEVDEALHQTSASYARSRGEKLRLEAELSKAQAEAAKSKDIEAATQRLRALLKSESSDVANLISSAQAAAIGLRQKAVLISDLLPRIESSLGFGSEASPKRDDLVAEVEVMGKALAQVEQELRKEEIALQAERSRQPTLNALRELVDLGKRLPWQHENCPLCGSAISKENFDRHVLEIERAVARDTGRIAELSERVRILRQQRDDKVLLLEKGNASLREWEARHNANNAAVADAYQKLTAVGLTVQGDPSMVRGALQAELKVAETDLSALQQDLIVLDASRQVQRVAELEKALEACAQELVLFDRSTMQTGGVRSKLKAALDTVRRYTGEVVDDRLAALSPLLQELYARLRPHVGWRELDYKIRGDIRRFLSLSVGEGLNPAFMFSSGQRRAAGLAFLLAINLARGWSNVQFMVLDDPVQHVDDFRALHLVEVLSSIRQSGRQVICTMEDDDLAGLLCRRLRASTTEGGAVVTMQFEPSAGITLKSQTSIEPLPTNILQAAFG